MTRYVLTVDLKDDPTMIAAYREHHRRVWPEVVKSLRCTGIETMEIYILDRRLVMIVETNGRPLEECFDRHVTSHPRVREWEQLMRSMQQPPPGGGPGEWWAVMQPLFRLDAAGQAPATSEPFGR